MIVCMNRFLVIVFLLFVAGCVTEELVVFKDSVVKKKAMEAFLGDYKVEAWPGNMKPKTIRVAEKDGKYRFAYLPVGKEKINAEFVLSKIPNSKKRLMLVSVPKQGDANDSNLFFVGQVAKDKTHLWVVFDNLPVAQGELQFTGGKAKAEDVKKFLASKGDAFVEANKPLVTLSKQRKKAPTKTKPKSAKSG